MDIVDQMCSRCDQFSQLPKNNEPSQNEIKSTNSQSDYMEREGISSINVLKAKMEQGKRKKFQRQRAVIKKEEKMDIITSFDQIDGIDDGKTWKKLDAWLRKKKLLAYMDSNNISEEDRLILLEKLKKGGLNSSKKVEYDSVAGKIIAIT